MTHAGATLDGIRIGLLILLLSVAVAVGRVAEVNILCMGPVQGAGEWIGCGEEPDWANMLAPIRALREGKDTLLIGLGDLTADQLAMDRLPAENRAVAEALGVDALAPDVLAWRRAAMRNAPLLKYPDIPNICANVSRVNAEPLSDDHSFVLLPCAGVRVAVIGLCDDRLPMCLLPEFARRLRIGKRMDALASCIARVRAAAPDIVLLVGGCVHESHGAERTVADIITRYPEVDILVGNGVEPALCTPVGTAWFGQPGHGPASLLRVTILFDTIRHEIIQVESALPQFEKPAPEIEAAAVHGIHGSLPDVSAALGRMIINATGADAALIPNMREVPDDWIGLVQITPPALRRVLGACTGNGLQLAGISLSEDGRLLDPSGQPIHGHKRLALAAPLGLWASACGRYPALRKYALSPAADLEIIRVSPRKLVQTDGAGKE